MGDVAPTQVVADEAGTGKDSAQLRPGLRNRIAVAALLAALLVGLAYCALPLRESDSQLRQTLIELRDYFGNPDEDLSVLAKRLETSDAIVDFLTNHIATSPYSRRLQTPEEVLTTRVGNPADKAILLQAMLKAISVNTSVHAAPLTGDLRKQVFAKISVPQKPAPEAFERLKGLIGYSDAEQTQDEQFALVDAAVEVISRNEVIEGAFRIAKEILPTSGPSSVPSTYLDWVWLVDDAGNVYDPVLAKEPRPEYWRLYDRSLSSTRISLIAEDKYGRRRPVLNWQGAAFGKSLTLGFLPTINPHERLQGTPDLSSEKLWTPVLKVGRDLHSDAAVTTDGEVLSGKIVQAAMAGEGTDYFDAPRVKSAEIIDVNASLFPKVRLRIGAMAATTPRWHAAHLSLSLPSGKVPVQIEQQFQEQHRVIVLADQTGSMLKAARYEIAKRFGQALVGNFPKSQTAALFAMRHSIHAEYLLENREDPSLLTADNFWNAPIGGQIGFIEALDVALNAIMLDFGEQPKLQTKIVLITDGEPNRFVDDDYRKEMDRLQVRAKLFNAAIVPVVVGNHSNPMLDHLAAQSGGEVVRIASLQSAREEAISLSNELAGSMVVSFVAPPVAHGYAKGDKLPFKLKIANFDGEISGQLIIPDSLTDGTPALFLRVESGEHSFSRRLMALGDGVDYRRFSADTNITLAAGYFDSNVIESRRYNRWLLALDALSDRTNEVAYLLDEMGVDVDDMERLNRIANLVQLTAIQGASLKFPLVTMTTSELAEQPDFAVQAVEDGPANDQTNVQRKIARTLDVPAWHSLALDSVSREQAMRLSLSLNDAEARSIGSTVNLTGMINGSDGTFNKASDELADRLARQNFGLPLEANANFLRLTGRNDVLWINNPQHGNLNGYLLRKAQTAKGTQDVVIAEKFARIRKAIDTYDVAITPLTGAVKIAYKGFIGFKLEELKMWCYSTIMLGYVNEVIAGEDDALLNESAKRAETRAAKLCKMDGGPGQFGENLVKGAVKDFAKAWGKEFIRKGFGGKGGTDKFAKPFIDKFTKATRLDKVMGELSLPVREYISKVSQSIRRKTPYTPEGIAETITNTGMDNVGSVMGTVFSSKVAGAIYEEVGGP